MLPQVTVEMLYIDQMDMCCNAAASPMEMESSSSFNVSDQAAAPAPTFALFSSSSAPRAPLFTTAPATAPVQTASTSKDPQTMSVRYTTSHTLLSAC